VFQVTFNYDIQNIQHKFAQFSFPLLNLFYLIIRHSNDEDQVMRNAMVCREVDGNIMLEYHAKSIWQTSIWKTSIVYMADRCAVHAKLVHSI
jgi:hypothetical protein